MNPPLCQAFHSNLNKWKIQPIMDSIPTIITPLSNLNLN